MTFETIPTHGSETSTNTDALATDPAEIKAFFAAINGKPATPTTSGKATTAAGGTVDPASITVDVQNAAKVSNLASSVSATLVAAGFKAGDVTTYPGITADERARHHHDRLPVRRQGRPLPPCRRRWAARANWSRTTSVAVGHISVAAGKDMPPPSGLRAAVLSGLAAGRRRADEQQPPPGRPRSPRPASAASTDAGRIGHRCAARSVAPRRPAPTATDHLHGRLPHRTVHGVVGELVGEGGRSAAGRTRELARGPGLRRRWSGLADGAHPARVPGGPDSP